ncbi:MAG: DNA mismatch repair protein MutS [Holosporales bacterium]|jgi:DNA mismatch repair protein MutS|nr:DNA mismatch repair protein MutS [Holosporales bacterium]
MTTPMLKQYRQIKEEHKDSLVFFRLGDFYELFFDDAKIASKELGIVLTKKAEGTPMCGIPWHAHEMYLTKLINNGHKVVICEQLETPEEAKKTRGASATINRGVVRIVTKGTLIESSLISERQSNFLLAISKGKENFGIAYADISTGVFKIEEIDYRDLLNCISKINPEEIICTDITLTNDQYVLETLHQYRSIIHPVPSVKFMKANAEKILANFYGMKFIDAMGKINQECIEAASLVVEYISNAYSKTKINLSFPTTVNQQEYVQIDYFTRRNLELIKPLNNNDTNCSKKSTLLHTIDKTITNQGARLLADWLATPLLCLKKIEKRQDFVTFFINNQDVLKEIRDGLQHFPDIERSLTRIIMNRCGPRDLNAVRISLHKMVYLHDEVILRHTEELNGLELLFDGVHELADILDNALEEDNLPNLARDGGFIKHGYDTDLDSFRNFVENGETLIKAMQKKYVSETGISNIKIKNNRVLGYFIETTSNNSSKIPYDFIHRQTLANCIRYTSKEVIDLSTKIYEAEGNSIRQELLVFENICERIQSLQASLKNSAQKISFLDCITSLAHLAIENNYTKPYVNEGYGIEIIGGRHPVVENGLLKNGENFVANDCIISEKSVISIVTGPNMGGKSTYIRQNALIVILAQMGSYVPASKAVIGIVDKIFSRIGASDDISSGRSTFMVEMTETALILRRATERSLVIMDEIGRGTSTYDGLAIAWAVIEEIHDNLKAKTLFATHYHELKNITKTIKNVKFLTVEVDESMDKITLMHRIKEGMANKSYGIHVALIAGFPLKTVKRAEKLLDKYKN